ncbi:MAG TPA: PP2C family protein-serine/threonine phosphatase [Capsulimonadaceae bacterium]|nr:PP2C family protein-serine/threonine phosphatase [Capsulimonadaceae bacterium]
MAELEATGRWEGDLIHTRKDGEQIVVASRWALQKNGMTVVLEVNRDVTAQRREQAEQAQYAREQKKIAEALQHSLLIAPPPDIYPGITVKAFYHSAQDDLLVGGDFFDIYALTENQIALVLGDATGKGLEAATFTAEIKFVLRAYLREYPSPALALERLNDFMVDKDRLDPLHLGQSYIAAAALVVNTSTGRVDAAMAGMEAPLILGSNGKETRLGPGGLLLGVSGKARYAAYRAQLGEDDILVLSTDGLVEARNPRRRTEFFGAERLTRAVRSAIKRSESLADVGEAVLERARRFAGGAIRDDVCLMLARRVPRR